MLKFRMFKEPELLSIVSQDLYMLGVIISLMLFVRETLSIVDRAYIVYDGKILFSGNRQEIIDNQDVRKVYLGENFSY